MLGYRGGPIAKLYCAFRYLFMEMDPGSGKRFSDRRIHYCDMNNSNIIYSHHFHRKAKSLMLGNCIATFWKEQYCATTKRVLMFTTEWIMNDYRQIVVITSYRLRLSTELTWLTSGESYQTNRKYTKMQDIITSILNHILSFYRKQVKVDCYTMFTPIYMILPYNLYQHHIMLGNSNA